MTSDEEHRTGRPRRVTVYIDGFNLYYGLLRPNPHLKWLDLTALAQALAPDAVVSVRYFTAKVRARTDPGEPKRQQIYLRALETLSGVSIHYGTFLSHEVSRPLAAPMPGQPPVVRVLDTEEKGSDVNLATFLLVDGMDRTWDESFVVTGDSDLAEPIRQAVARFGPVHVRNPRSQPSRELQQVASSYGSLHTSTLAACQLPDRVRLPSGRWVYRPPTWR